MFTFAFTDVNEFEGSKAHAQYIEAERQHPALKQEMMETFQWTMHEESKGKNTLIKLIFVALEYNKAKVSWKNV